MSVNHETIENDLSQAFEVRDKEALRRFARGLEDAVAPSRRLEGDLSSVKRDTDQLLRDSESTKRDMVELKSDVRLIAERMEQGFARMDERFEAMDRLNMAR
ncbi:MAG: hypothetical protein ACLFPV_01905, partial [Spirochaetaceae bacterium]